MKLLRSHQRRVHLRPLLPSTALDQPDRARELRCLGQVFRGRIRQLVFLPGGDLLALAGRGVLRLNPETGELVDTWLPERDIEQLELCGESLALLIGDEVFVAPFGSPLGAPLATLETTATRYDRRFAASRTHLALPLTHGLELVEVKTGSKRLLRFDAEWLTKAIENDHLQQTAFSPDGQWVGVADSDQKVVGQWHLESNEHRPHAFVTRTDHPLRLLDDGGILRVDGPVEVLGRGETRYATRHEHQPIAVDAEGVTFADAWGSSYRWSFATDQKTDESAGSPSHYGRVSGDAVAAVDGARVAAYAASAGELYLHRAGKTEVFSDWLALDAFSISDDGTRMLAHAGWGKGQAELVDLTNRETERVRPESEDMEAAFLTGDGQHVVFSGGSILRARPCLVADFAGNDAEQAHELKSCTAGIVRAGPTRWAISTYTLSGKESGFVGIWEAGTKRIKYKLTHNDEKSYDFAISSDGGRAFINWKNAATVHELGKKATLLETLERRLAAVALGPRGTLAYLFCDDGLRLCVRHADSESTVAIEPNPLRSGENIIAFGAQGQLLFVGRGDGVLEVRRSQDGALLHSLPLHAGGFKAMQVHETVLWTLGEDGLVLAVGIPA